MPRLKPAAVLAKANPVRIPNESAAYRKARQALLVEEIELRRQIERVAALRRKLPKGAPVKDYEFRGAEGVVNLSDLFGDKETLVAYSFMYGPQRKKPCPMCTAQMAAWEGEALDIGQRVAFVMIARSSIERLLEHKKARGWKHLRMYSDPTGEYTRAFVDPEDGDSPAYNVFTRRDGTLRHFWSGEIFATEPDPGQDPRGAPDMMPLWNVLDTTPEGRGTDWYPKLEYK